MGLHFDISWVSSPFRSPDPPALQLCIVHLW